MSQQAETVGQRVALTPAQGFQAAQRLLWHGRTHEAEQLYRAVLQLAPNHVGALHHLGILCTQRGRMTEAAELIGRSLALDPRSAQARNDFGIALSGLGRLQDAAAEFKQAITLEPDFADAHNNLGNAFQQLGRHAEAAAAFENAFAIRPSFAEAHNNLGNALSSLGRQVEAIAHYEHAARLKPKLAEAHYNAALALSSLDRHERAIEYYGKALAIRPNYADANAGLGKALASLHRHADALPYFERALALQPSSPEAHNRLGNALVALDRHEEAIVYYRTAIEMRPGLGEAHNNLGNALVALDRHEEAVEQFRGVISGSTGVDKAIVHQAYNHLGGALMALRRPQEAIGYFEKVLGGIGGAEASNGAAAAAATTDSTADAKAQARAHSNLGNALVELSRADEAIGCFEQALAIDPDLATALHGLGSAYLALGRLDEARQSFERAVALEPAQLEFHRSLAEAKKFEPDDRQFALLQQMARKSDRLSTDHRIELHFSLGKAYADLEQHELSFQHYNNGNALKRRQIEYDEAMTIGKLDRSEKVFTPDLIARFSGAGDPSELPVFIVGMPRSGTTLVEQMLASHPKVFGAGELESFARVAGRICEPQGAAVPYPAMLPTLSREQVRALGAQYLEAVRAAVPAAQDARRVTDKMPANFRLVGLIHLALPHARIIHIRRDAVDTCLSCYAKLFRGWQPFTYDLGELGRYYRAYDSLMAHWRRVLPAGVMLELQYEGLVANFEPEARRVVAHCGLEWDQRCLEFHRTARPVRTASAAQVRQPLYRSAIGRWRVYEPWLAPLRKALAGEA